MHLIFSIQFQIMQNISAKIFLPLRLCAKHHNKYCDVKFLFLIKTPESCHKIFTRNFHKQIDEPNQSNSFKNSLEFIKAHPAKSIQSKKLNIKSLQNCWALAIFLNNKEAYPFVKQSEDVGNFTETWINDNIFENKKNITKREWIALEEEVRHISVSDLRYLIKVLPETLKNSKEDYNKLSKFLDQTSRKTLKTFNKNNKEQAFQICYSWFDVLRHLDLKMGVQNDWRLSGIRFPQQFTEQAMDFVSHLTHGELLFVILISNFYQHLPSCETFSVGNYYLSKQTQTKLVQSWPSWNCLEQTLICGALHACRINLNLRKNHAMRD